MDKVNSFISTIERHTYATLQNLCRPNEPAEVKYDALIALMKNHYAKNKVEIAETFKFHHIFQGETESVANFVGRLRSQASNCNYGDFLNRAPCDQFVVGLFDKEDQTHVLNQTKEINDCITFATASDVTRAQVKRLGEIQRTQTKSEVHAVHAGVKKEVAITTLQE